MPRDPGRRALGLLPVALLAGGCAGPGGTPLAHDVPELTLVEGERARLRSDLPPEDALRFRDRLDALEAVLDAAFPFLPAPTGPKPLALVLADRALFQAFARAHGTSAQDGAFACRGGEVAYLFRPEDWTSGPPFPLEPRIRPLAAAAFQRRLQQALSPALVETWLEEGATLVFVELAAHEVGERALAVKQARERLLDAFLPLYLGEAPALARAAATLGVEEKRRFGAPPLAWAAARFLLADADRTRTLALGLRRAAGQDAPGWPDALARLEAQEAAFEDYLRDAVLQEMLRQYVEAPDEVGRFEATAVLRLVANVDLDGDAPDAQRVQLARATRAFLDEHPPASRFLAAWEGELAVVREARSRLQAMQRLQALVSRELERRGAGFGHPALEEARQHLGRRLQRALDARGG